MSDISKTVRTNLAIASGINQINPFVIDELKLRSQNFGFNFVQNTSRDSMKDYRGNLSAWCRVSSFNDPGFILYGGEKFVDIYGFNQSSNTVIGYQFDGKAHTINDILPHRPCPGIESIDIDMNGGQGKFWEAVINWKCHSIAQLQYMERYFLTPSISVFIEYGWNTFNPKSLVNLIEPGTPLIEIKDKTTGFVKQSNGTGYKGLFTDDSLILEKIKISNGNYGLITGIIKTFDVKLNEMGGFDCSTSVCTKSGLFNSFLISDTTTKTKDEKSPPSFINFLTENKNNFLTQYSKEFFSWDDVRNKYIGGTPGSKDSPDNLFIRMKAFIDILNSYTTTVSDLHPEMIMDKFDINDVFISAHPNLKSCDGKVLLIMNPSAPAWINGSTQGVSEIDYEQSITNNTTLSSENKILLKVLHTSVRMNLANVILNAKNGNLNPTFKHIQLKYEDVVFPSYSYKDKTLNGYCGLLGNLYINYEQIISCFKSKTTIYEGLQQLLNTMSTAAGGIWDLKIIPRNVHDNAASTIRDSKFISIDQHFISEEPYTINLNSAKSFIKSFEFGYKPSDNIINNFFSQNSSDPISGGGQTQLIGIDRNDLITGKSLFKQPIPQNTEKNNKERVPDIDQRYCFLKSIETQKHIVFVEPDQQRLKELIKLPEVTTNENKNVNNGIIPGIQINLTILGISGFSMFDVFRVVGLPSTYSDNLLWMISKIKHSIRNNEWITTITAGPMPYVYRK